MTKTEIALDKAINEWMAAQFGRQAKNDVIATPIVRKAIDVDDEGRAVTGVITSEIVDRDGEVVMVKGLDVEQFNKNPVVLFMHDAKAVIGRSIWLKAQRRQGVNRILAKTKFADTDIANEVFELIKGDFLRGFSIGLSHHGMELKDVTPADVRKNPDSNPAT
ncbi:hypothetical protein LCGC14_1917430 [marine sediment metagenome]|uniref:Uncharacterized protein n=1 Tax=marine sediment metagenome TaxID=412755 RepID=A0A0F9IPJ6_9ZZZZ